MENGKGALDLPLYLSVVCQFRTCLLSSYSYVRRPVNELCMVLDERGSSNSIRSDNSIETSFVLLGLWKLERFYRFQFQGSRSFVSIIIWQFKVIFAVIRIFNIWTIRI